MSENIIKQQVMWNRLIAICEEQAQVMLRAAFSPPVRESGDLSAGLFDLQGRMIAQAVTGTPGHVNSMAAAVVHFFDEFPVASMRPNDAYITNDPWLASGHLNDVTVVTPAFLGDKLVGLFAATVHLVDVGGRGMGPDASDVFEEGVCIPHMYLVRGGELNRDLIRIITVNSREPLQTEGDLLAILAAGDEGPRRLSDMLVEFDQPDLDALTTYILETSNAAARQAIRQLPDGTYRNTMTVDGYEFPVTIEVCMVVDDGRVALDFSGSSGISRYGINVPLIYTSAYAFYGIKCVLAPDVPSNQGTLSLFTISAPVGSILNPQRPAPVSARHIIGHCVADAVMGCLAMAMPDRVVAESGIMWNPYFRGHTGEGEKGRMWEFFSLIAGGMGARASKDGLSATAFPSALKGIPIEAMETTAPLIVWRKELRQDSGGVGEFRGGLGQRIVFASLDESPIRFQAMFDRVQNPARGRAGGGDGMTGSVSLTSGKPVRAKGQQDIDAGDRLILETPGGGGYGDPANRKAQDVHREMREGLISEEAARRSYPHAF